MQKGKIINWGIMGSGKRAYDFAKSLATIKHGRLVAVASRNHDRAMDFANTFQISQYYSSYSQLANNSEIDIVYIATPNSCHKENALICLNANKGVLVEKPFTTNADDAKILIDLSQKKKLFLMEAMWTRFIPAFDRIDRLIQSDTIGEVRFFTATLGLPSRVDLKSNLFNSVMGGGSILDLGVYPIFLSEYFFGSPMTVKSSAYYGDTDVDLMTTVILNYSRGRQASITSSITNRLSNNGYIYGTKGMIEIHQPLYCPTALTVVSYGKEEHVKGGSILMKKALDYARSSSLLKNLYANHPLIGQFLLRNRRKFTINLPIKGNGLQYMAEDVSNYLINRPSKSNIIPLSSTMSVMQTIEKIRAEWHV